MQIDTVKYGLLAPSGVPVLTETSLNFECEPILSLTFGAMLVLGSSTPCVSRSETSFGVELHVWGLDLISIYKNLVYRERRKEKRSMQET